MGAVRRSLLLRALMDREEFADLMALYKRAANLAAPAMAAAAGAPRGRDDGGVRPELFSLPQEEPLYRSLPAAAAGVDGLLAAVSTQVAPVDPAKRPQMDLVGLEAPLAQVIGLKAPLDAFLDGVLVMAEDEAVKRNRLGLLAGVVAPLRRLGSLEFLE